MKHFHNLQLNLVSKRLDPTLELTKTRSRLCSNERGVLMSAPTRSPKSEEQTIWLAGISWYLQWFSQYFWSHLQCLFHFPLFYFTLGTNSTLEPTKTHWRLCSMIEIHVPDKVSYYMEVKGGVVQGTRFCEAGRCMIEKTVVCKCLVWCIVDMAKRVRPVWPDPFDPQPV